MPAGDPDSQPVKADQPATLVAVSPAELAEAMVRAAQLARETSPQRINRELIELLNEIRVALPGVQVLLAFLLAVPFSARFASASSFQRDVYFTTVVLTLISTVFLIAPSAYHRLNFRRRRKDRILFVSNQLMIAGIAMLALSLTAVVVLITSTLYSQAAALAAGAAALALMFAMWFVLPRAHAWRTGDDDNGDVEEPVFAAVRSRRYLRRTRHASPERETDWRRVRSVRWLFVFGACVLSCGLAASSAAIGERSGGARQTSRTEAAAIPALLAGVRALLATRQGEVGLEVYDPRGHARAQINARGEFHSESIVKVSILGTLLRDSDRAGKPIGEEDLELARSMIEVSDNDAAQDLYLDVGDVAGVTAFDRSIGMRRTFPNDYFGETLTTAADQIILLAHVLHPGALGRASVHLVRTLMSSVDPSQRWGVSAGAPAGAQVFIKNGWSPLSSDDDWEINSIGYIDGPRRKLLIAVLTSGDPSEAYGIATIEAVARRVEAALRGTSD